MHTHLDSWVSWVQWRFPAPAAHWHLSLDWAGPGMGNGRPGSLFERCLESASLSPVGLSSQENTVAVKAQGNLVLTKWYQYAYRSCHNRNRMQHDNCDRGPQLKEPTKYHRLSCCTKWCYVLKRVKIIANESTDSIRPQPKCCPMQHAERCCTYMYTLSFSVHHWVYNFFDRLVKLWGKLSCFFRSGKPISGLQTCSAWSSETESVAAGSCIRVHWSSH